MPAGAARGRRRRRRTGGRACAPRHSARRQIWGGGARVGGVHTHGRVGAWRERGLAGTIPGSPCWCKAPTGAWRSRRLLGWQGGNMWDASGVMETNEEQ